MERGDLGLRHSDPAGVTHASAEQRKKPAMNRMSARLRDPIPDVVQAKYFTEYKEARRVQEARAALPPELSADGQPLAVRYLYTFFGHHPNVKLVRNLYTDLGQQIRIRWLPAISQMRKMLVFWEAATKGVMRRSAASCGNRP